MLTEREEMIVAWLRREARGEYGEMAHEHLAWWYADAIERGAHLKRPEPTIPASE